MMRMGEHYSDGAWIDREEDDGNDGTRTPVG